LYPSRILLKIILIQYACHTSSEEIAVRFHRSVRKNGIDFGIRKKIPPVSRQKNPLLAYLISMLDLCQPYFLYFLDYCRFLGSGAYFRRDGGLFYLFRFGGIFFGLPGEILSMLLFGRIRCNKSDLASKNGKHKRRRHTNCKKQISVSKSGLEKYRKIG